MASVASARLLLTAAAGVALLVLVLPAGAAGPANADHRPFGEPYLWELRIPVSPEGRVRQIAQTGPDNLPLAVAAPYLNHSVIDSGQRLVLLVNITGGYKPYNITWLGLPGGGCRTHNQSSFGCDVGAPSGLPTTFEVSVKVIDVMGTAATSNSTPVTVNPAPMVAVDISPASGGVPPFTLTFTAVPTYGTPPFRYFWLFGDGVNSTGPTVERTFTSLGNFGVTLWGNDSLGYNVSGYAKIHSVAAPSVAIDLTPRTSVTQGASVSFSVEPSGGLGPFSYDWIGLPDFCPPVTQQNETEVTCAGATPGIYTVTVVLTDSLQHTANSSVTLTVTAPPSVWEYVAISATGVAVALAIVVVVQLVRYRRQRRTPPALEPADVAPPN